MQIVEMPSAAGFDLRWGDGGRDPGVHLSQILAYMAITARILKPDDTDLGELIEETDTDVAGEDGRLVRIAVGLAWERWLVRQKRYRNVIYHPGVFWLDGIAGSPDGLVFEGGGGHVEEYKTTKKSSLRNIETAWLWWEQCRGYCKMTGLRKAVLRVLYLNGDYRGNPMVFRSYATEFTEEELDSSWRRIVMYRDRVMPEKGRK